MNVIGSRLKEARLPTGMSQEELGVKAGLDEASASARMNRYERGTRIPGLELLQRLGALLNLPVTYFYCVSDDEAKLLVAFHRMSPESRRRLLDSATSLTA